MLPRGAGRTVRCQEALSRKTLRETLVAPDTLLRWYRQLVAANYDGSDHRSPGRPRTAVDIVALVLRIARENESWGYTRVQGALKNLGHDIGRSTMQRVLAEHGIDPAPERGKVMPWKNFLAAHVAQSPPLTSSPSRFSRRAASCGITSSS